MTEQAFDDGSIPDEMAAKKCCGEQPIDNCWLPHNEPAIIQENRQSTENNHQR